MKTIAYNSILVYDPDEDITRGETRDGGQIYAGQKSDIADMRFESAPAYVFAEGDIGRAYSSGKVSLLKRRTIRLNEPDIYLMFDRIQVKNKYFVKKWIMHSTNRPMVAEPGSLLSVERQTDEVINIANYRGDLTTVTADGSRLFVKTILPDSHRVRIVGGPGYEFWVDDPGTNYPLVYRTEAAEPGSWRMEVIPETDIGHEIFLHALYPTVHTEDAAPECERLDSDGTIGVKAADWVVQFSRSGAALDSLSYSLDHAGTLHHLITDFRWGGVIVLQDSVETARVPVSDEGNIYFSTGGGGDFVIVVDPSSTAPEQEADRRPGSVPDTFELSNYPNPFNPSTTVGFRVAFNSEIDISIYNLKGQKVRGLERGDYSPGTYRISWDGRDDHGCELPSGIYICRLNARDPDGLRSRTGLSRKMTLMR
jgi:hypothetical protein